MNYTTCNVDIFAINSFTLYNYGGKEYDFFIPLFNLGKVDNNVSVSNFRYVFKGLQNPPNITLRGCSAQT